MFSLSQLWCFFDGFSYSGLFAGCSKRSHNHSPVELAHFQTTWQLPRLQDAIKAQPVRASDLQHALKLAEAAELSEVKGVQTGACNMEKQRIRIRKHEESDRWPIVKVMIETRLRHVTIPWTFVARTAWQRHEQD